MKYRALFCIVWLLSIPSICNTKPIDKKDLQPQEVWINIFVHGIISLKPYLNVSNALRFMQDDIDGTPYARSIELTREDPFFYQYHTMQERGLHKIDLSITQQGAASVAFAKAFDQISHYSAQNPSKNYYYTFGWSGLLSQRARFLDAIRLHEAIEKELQQYHAHTIQPKLRIIGYSHGANLALELAGVDKEKKPPAAKNLSINELILVGAPLLPESNHLVYSSLFKKIYHFFSYGDHVQQMDFFSSRRILSYRTFKKHTGFALPKNLVQITVQIKRPKKGREQFFENEENFNDGIAPYRLLRTSDPGHSELWSFGWVPSGYRKNLPLHPLPFAAYSPFLIGSIQQFEPHAKKISLELHPYAERMIIKNRKTKKKTSVPFLSKQELLALQETVEAYRPENFTQELYSARIQQHKDQAHSEWLSKHKIRRFGHYRICLARN